MNDKILAGSHTGDILKMSKIENKKETPPQSLYKFRSFQDFEYVMDILVNERLYCPPYKDLNDPFEGTFIALFRSFRQMKPGRPKPTSMIPTKNMVFKNVDELNADLQETRVCSLSSDYKDVRLWAHYADGHKGIAIKIDFRKTNSDLHEVEYSKDLPTFERKDIKNLDAVDILTKKTDHWDYESEYRIIGGEEYYSISDKIEAIFLGPRVQHKRADLLMKLVSGKVPVYSTKLNQAEVKIEKGKKLN